MFDLGENHRVVTYGLPEGDKRLSASHLSAVTGVPTGRINSWARKGYIESQPCPDRGKSYLLYDQAAVRRVADLRDLGWLGIPVNKAVDILDGYPELRRAGRWFIGEMPLEE